MWGDWIFMLCSGQFGKCFKSMFKFGCCVLIGFILVIGGLWWWGSTMPHANRGYDAIYNSK
jgi:hypothetical protein